jgi:signal transduction histidine kinase
MTFVARRGGRLDMRGVRLTALLVIAVIVPSLCVLWFMNEAARNQADASRSAVLDAYRGQLRLVRARVNAYWEARAAELEGSLTGSAASDFKRLTTGGDVDSVVILSGRGHPLYPSIASGNQQTTVAASRGAAAAQGLVQSLLRTNNRPAAIDAITRYFIAGPTALARDSTGRLIAADEQLLLVTLLRPTDSRRAPAIRRLVALLNDYGANTIPSPQRTFLMRELTAAEAASVADFPTLEAERLALTYLERDRPLRAGTGVRPTTVSEVWQALSPKSRMIALYRTETVDRAIRASITDDTSSGLNVLITKPGQPPNAEAIPVGPALPGWDVSFAPDQLPGGTDAQSGFRKSYMSIALLAIAAIAAAVVTIGTTAGRQARLASLRTDLVATVSHELKTPLASMRLLVDTLLEDERLDPVKTRDYLRLMAGENARLTRLMENFLTFSRLDRSKYRFTFEPTDPSDIARDALGAMPEGRRGDRGPVLEIASDLPSVVADRDALVTALLNLLDNAYKYGPADGPVSLRVFRDAGHVVFAVQDRGIGIPRREQKRIFRRFYRIDQRLTRTSSGSGLGLSIVDAIARAHGGSVKLQSAPEHGSTFSLYLPAAAEGATV